MTARERWREYLSLSAAAGLVSYVFIQALVFLHEVAHGGTALALGGHFLLLQFGLTEGRAVYVFPLDSPPWKEVLVLFAGPLANFAAAVIVLGLAAAGVGSRRARLLLLLLAGELAALGFIFGSGLLSAWLPAGGDIGRALGLLGLPRVYKYLFGGVWVLLGAAVAVSLFRLIFRELAESFPVGTYAARLCLVVSAVTVPGSAIYGAEWLGAGGVAAGAEGETRAVPLLLGSALIVSLTFLLPLAVGRVGPEGGGRRFAVPGRPLLIFLAAAVALAAARPLVFGGDRDNPRGLFLSRRPPEVSVSACNVLLTLGGEYRARVRVLMRPFTAEQKFLWERIKDAEPEDWAAYESFVRQKIPLMLGTEDFQIVARYADPGAEFFNGTWGRGARVVEAEVNLSGLPYQRGSREVRVLRVADFWRSRGLGYIDLTRISLEGGLQISGLRTQPAGSGVPALRSPQQLQWENTDFNRSFAVSYVGVSNPPAPGLTGAE